MRLLREDVTQAHRDAAFQLDLCAFGIDDHAHVLGANDAFDLHGSFGGVHGDCGDGGHVGPGVNAARHAVTALAGGLRGRPAEVVGGGLQDANHPGVTQVVQSEFHRVDSCAGGHDVNVRLAA